MRYIETSLDKNLKGRFANDNAHAHLRSIGLSYGNLRGLNDIELNFDYPITAIAGKNGSGKSTILAMACCAYHNDINGFIPQKRKTTYYTFSDFFIQHRDEVPPQGIGITYGIAYNNWVPSQEVPSGSGIGHQVRSKSHGGKWNDYADRVPRNVVFLGLERIVPHSERSQSRSYSRVFKDTDPKGWEEKVKNIVGRILNKTYNNFRYVEHSKYSLPIVQCGKTVYSGFNMGAGENALFEIFSTIYSAGNGTLLVLDEIELGLHAEAQKKLINELKEVCWETHTQIICTTHSKEIFEALPYEARIFIEPVNGSIKIFNAISSDLAFSKMASRNILECDVYVEDGVAHTILTLSLPNPIRSRLNIKPIGSAQAVSRQLAATNLKGEERPTIAIFDGDQQILVNDNLRHFKNMIEIQKPDLEAWFKKRSDYLPGSAWPEKWVLEKCLSHPNQLCEVLGMESGEVIEMLKHGISAGKHQEFRAIGSKIGMEDKLCMQQLVSVACRNGVQELAPLIKRITSLLD